MCRDATWRNPKLSKCVDDLKGINGQLVGLEQLHGSSFFVNVYQRVARNTFLPNTEHSPENVA